MKFSSLLVATALVAATSSAFAGTYTDTTANNSFATAVELGNYFSNGFNADVGDVNGTNTSLSAPWVTVLGVGDGARDYYKFTTTAASNLIFDIDYTQSHPSNPLGFDSNLRVFDSSFGQLAYNDDYSSNAGAAGSVHSYDSFVQLNNAAAGTYYVEVGVCCQAQNIGAGRNYTLQLQAASVVSSVPEPESYAMMGLGLGALAFVARRRKNQA